MLESKENFVRNIKKCVSGDIASDLTVAVMTVCGSLNSSIDLLEIFNHCTRYPNKDFTLSYVPNTKNVYGEKTKAFYNCLNVTYYYTDSDCVKSKIAAKVFPNGSIQLPGCKTIESVHNAPKILADFVESIAEDCAENNPGSIVIKDPEKFVLSDVRIVMINSNFEFKNNKGDIILQERLKDIINEYKFEDGDGEHNVWRMASFQPEKYSGINARYMTKRCRKEVKEMILQDKKVPMKLDGQVSILIFRSGKATITGAKNTDDLLETYKVITSLVHKHRDKVFHSLEKNIV